MLEPVQVATDSHKNLISNGLRWIGFAVEWVDPSLISLSKVLAKQYNAHDLLLQQALEALPISKSLYKSDL